MKLKNVHYVIIDFIKEEMYLYVKIGNAKIIVNIQEVIIQEII